MHPKLEKQKGSVKEAEDYRVEYVIVWTFICGGSWALVAFALWQLSE